MRVFMLLEHKQNASCLFYPNILLFLISPAPISSHKCVSDSV